MFPADENFDPQDIMLSTNHITATFSGSTGFLQSVAMGNHEVSLCYHGAAVSSSLSGQAVGVAMEMVTYGTRAGKSHSGAYLFLPDGKAQPLLPSGSKPHITVTTGPLVSDTIPSGKVKGEFLRCTR